MKKTHRLLLQLAIALLLSFNLSTRAGMVLQGLSGPVTGTEISSFETFMQGQPPTNSQTYDNTLADGNTGMNAEALGLMYEVTNDPAILNMMIVYSDTIISLRNDFTDRRVMWDGNVDPVWLTKPSGQSDSGYAGCENNDIVGHVAYCARLILQTPALWNTTVPDGNPHGYGVTYFQRATNYIAQMEVVQDSYMIPYFIDSSTHRITAPTSSAWTSLNENTTAWNRQMMFMNGFQRLSECHQLLGDNPAKVALYDSIVSAAMSWFFSSLQPGSASGHPVYNWTYCPTCSGSEDNTLHSTYDIWGSTRAYASGRYGVSNSTLVGFANTLQYVMNIATNTISYYVNGTDGSNGSRNFIYPGWMPICYSDPCDFAITANMDSSRQSSTPIYDAMILWIKNARYVGSYPNACGSVDFSVGTQWFQTVALGGSTNLPVTVNSLSGFNSTVTLSASGLPAGVTANFSPSSITGSGVSTLTLSASGSATVGTYGLTNGFTVVGTSSIGTRTAPINLVLTAAPGFTVSATPSSQPVPVGSATSYTVNVGSIDGFSGNVALAVGGLPTGASGVFSPSSVAAPGSSTLNVTTTGTTPAGNDTLTITGASGGVTNSTTVTLAVNDFTVSTTPASQTVSAGGGTNYTVTIGNNNGFSGTVALTAAGLPTGATAVFNPTSINSLGSSTLTVSTTPSTPAGTNNLTITGTSGSLSHNSSTKLVVTPAADFSISAAPGSQTVTAGNGTSYTATITALNGFGGNVTLTAGGLPSGATAAFNPTSVTGSGSSTVTITTSTGTPAGTNTLTLTGTSGSLVHNTTVTLIVNAASSGLPAGWTDKDIGSVGLAGSGSYSSGVFTVKGSGSDIWSNGDLFNYAYASATNDLTITARVATQQSANGWSKSGVMLRASTATNSAYVALYVTPSNGVSMQFRSATGSNAVDLGRISGPAAPYWVRLVRSGNTYTGYSSADGATWTQVAATNFTLATNILAGLAVCAHDNTALNTSTFDNVAVLPIALTDADIGSPGLAGSASFSGGVYIVKGSGADIYGTSDQFNYDSEAASGNLTITARVASLNSANAWSKSGVMIRETTAANSAYVGIYVTTSNGIDMQYRSSTGASAVDLARASGVSAPYWVQLVRSGNTFTGYSSADGITWTQVGSISVTMATNATTGLAVCSHSNTALNTSTFDNLSIH